MNLFQSEEKGRTLIYYVEHSRKCGHMLDVNASEVIYTGVVRSREELNEEQFVSLLNLDFDPDNDSIKVVVIDKYVDTFTKSLWPEAIIALIVLAMAVIKIFYFTVFGT